MLFSHLFQKSSSDMSSLSLFLRFVICDGTISSLFATFGTLLLTDAMLVKVPFVWAQFPRYSRRSELCSSLTRCSSRFHSCKHDETFPRYSRKKSLWFLYHSDSIIYNATSESSKFFSFILTIHPIYIFRFSILSFYSVFLFSLSCIATIRMRKTKRNTGNSATDM